MEKKRKIDSECRKFKDQWNIQYFVTESSNKALCLICNESIAVLKEYNMKRHYETKHSQNYSKYTGIVRTEKFEALKRGLKSQQSLFTKVKTEQEAATRASFRVALEIAKRGKPFTDGEMIKECIIAVVEEMCPEKVNLLKTVSMSANTVARRVENIAGNISSQLFDKNGHVEWFSLALDESTDVSDTAQVLIYIRGVDKSYEVHEELLDMYSIHGTTTGTDIFKGVEMAINKKNLRWKNLKCITTDGGKNMSGKDKGVVALVSKAVENDGGSKPLVLHCIIHQQSLCGKCLDMSDVLKPVISTVNFIRSFGLNHRQFRQFIAEIGETDLPYHTAVRWLSCGKVLQRFFELRAVIEIFLNEKHRPLTELQNNAWLWKLAFYVDLTKHVNELNLRLQGENQHLPDLYTNIKSFRMKLILFQSQLRSKCFSHFKTCEIFSYTTETEFPIDFAIETLSALKINFDTRFSDFDAIANQIKIFQNPFDADIETLAPELQMEMIDLQCSDIIKNKYENSSLLEFYKSLPLTQFDNLHKFARGLFSVFDTTSQGTSADPLTDRQRREQADHPNDTFFPFDLTSSRQCSRRQTTINFTEATSFFKLYMERLPRQKDDKQRSSLLTELSSKLFPLHTIKSILDLHRLLGRSDVRLSWHHLARSSTRPEASRHVFSSPQINPFIHLDPTLFTKTRFIPFAHNKKYDIAHPQIDPIINNPPSSPPQQIELQHDPQRNPLMEKILENVQIPHIPLNTFYLSSDYAILPRPIYHSNLPWTKCPTAPNALPITGSHLPDRTHKTKVQRPSSSWKIAIMATLEVLSQSQLSMTNQQPITFKHDQLIANQQQECGNISTNEKPRELMTMISDKKLGEAKLRSGRPSTCKSVAVTVSQNVEAIETLSTYGEVSARQISRQTGISYGTVCRELRFFLKKYPYEIKRFHTLKVGDFEKRQEFAAWVLRQIDIDENWLSNVLWTDEAHLSLNAEVS
ncbi:EPM2AIP1 [Cordylochernes scorpioides]|uniref:EPM2AIP1 n=1 Tax=Cordylochernes scorpioides TaxID=51811 RepID=A0ABY6KKK3_9ARAC|nr:EPM2AIP1 [Cordylochernes scorpioides]